MPYERFALRLLTVREAAALLKLSEPTLGRLIARGELPHIGIGHSTRIAASDLEACLARRTSSQYGLSPGRVVAAQGRRRSQSLVSVYPLIPASSEVTGFVAALGLVHGFWVAS